MLSSSEMIMDSSGKMKTLEDFIKSLAGQGAEEVSEKINTVTWETATLFPTAVQTALSDLDNYDNVLITVIDVTKNVYMSQILKSADFKTMINDAVSTWNVLFVDLYSNNSVSLIKMSFAKAESGYTFRIDPSSTAYASLKNDTIAVEINIK